MAAVVAAKLPPVACTVFAACTNRSKASAAAALGVRLVPPPDGQGPFVAPILLRAILLGSNAACATRDACVVALRRQRPSAALIKKLHTSTAPALEVAASRRAASNTSPGAASSAVDPTAAS